MIYTLLSLNIAPVTEIKIRGRKVMTAMGKRPVCSRVAVQPLGIQGDEQADLSIHGGLSKAVYAYPNEHYHFWQTMREKAQLSLWGDALTPGALGENLTLAGLLENQVWMGDLLRFRDCTLEVTEPRFPCFKFNASMGFNQASKLMATSGWCGFYLAVKSAGTLRSGERFELIPGPRKVSVPELFRTGIAKKHP